MMAVSPPPANILSSSINSTFERAPDDLGISVQQNAWRQIVRNVQIAGPHLTPVPFINKPHYFDLLSVFTETDETILDMMRSTVVKTEKFKYVGSLKSIIRFGTDNKVKMDDIVQIKDQTPATLKNVIEHSVMGNSGEVQVNYHLHIENPHVHALHFKLDPEIRTGIDRNTPGLRSTSALLIVAEVFSGSGVFIMTETKDHKANKCDELFHYELENDPVPLAFAALRISVGRNGVFNSPPEVVPPGKLAELEYWILRQANPPEDSPTIKTLTDGQTSRLRNQAGKFHWPANKYSIKH